MTFTSDPFDEEGYLRTGDILEIAGDERQYLRYVDRSKDMVVRGGMKISAAELEGFIAGHPKVADVAVVAYPDEVLGERACAVVVPRPAAGSTRAGFPGPGAQVQPGGPVSQPATSGGQNTSVSSSNWAGYAATGAAGRFTSVSASWTQPTASCAAGSQYGAFWVGLDGYTSKTVEQTGTEADCTGPAPQYYAWYEVYPGAGVNFTNPVSPGDKFTGTVTSQGNDKFQLVLKDITQGWTQTINATASGADLSSAEAIAEAPSGTSGTSSVLPLTNFGSVSFTGVTANGKSLDTLDPVQISMPDTSVADMASDGSFAVNYTGTGFAQWFGF